MLVIGKVKAQHTATSRTPYVSNKTGQPGSVFPKCYRAPEMRLVTSPSSGIAPHQARGQRHNPLEIHRQVWHHQKRSCHRDALFGIMRPTKEKALLLVIKGVFHTNFPIRIMVLHVAKEFGLYQNLEQTKFLHLITICFVTVFSLKNKTI